MSKLKSDNIIAIQDDGDERHLLLRPLETTDRGMWSAMLVNVLSTADVSVAGRFTYCASTNNTNSSSKFENCIAVYVMSRSLAAYAS
jgi:hypothetical protein